MIKAVLFDFDGVLTLDETGSQSICNYISRVAGIEKDVFKNEYRKYNKDLLIGDIKHEDVWQKICDAIGRPIEIEILRDSFINTPINTDILALIHKIKSINLKVAMVTDNKADRIKSIVSHYHWEALFDKIAVSAEIGSGKEREEIFLSTFQSLSVNPKECIFIDNNHENLVVPNGLGVNTFYFDCEKNDVDGLTHELVKYGIMI